MTTDTTAKPEGLETIMLPIKRSRNDLFADTRCTCPWVNQWTGEESKVLTHTVTLDGYNDANFWNTVGDKPREAACKCGRRYRYTWTRGGVEFAWLDAPVVVCGEAP